MREERCFADRGRYCNILTERKCARCTFHQTKKQLEHGREAARARLLRICPNLYEKYNH